MKLVHKFRTGRFRVKILNDIREEQQHFKILQRIAALENFTDNVVITRKKARRVSGVIQKQQPNRVLITAKAA
jgi:adenosine/AMP kinase